MRIPALNKEQLEALSESERENYGKALFDLKREIELTLHYIKSVRDSENLTPLQKEARLSEFDVE